MATNTANLTQREREIVENLRAKRNNEEELLEYINGLSMADLGWLRVNYGFSMELANSRIDSVDIGWLGCNDISDEDFEKYLAIDTKVHLDIEV